MRIRYRNTYLLGACVLIMALLCFLSIDSPMRFDRQLAKRETVVKTRLIKIRKAEEQYRMKNGAYAGSFDALVKSGMLADSLRIIPYSNGQQFFLRASSITGKGGQEIPLMECGAQYKQYLKGLDETSVTDLAEEASTAGRFPGLKIGDLETPNNNAGNWE